MIFIKKQKNKSKDDFWIGFSDLMTGLMLVFIVLSLTFMAIANERIEEANKSKEEIEKLLKKLKEATENLEKNKRNIIVILSEKLASNNIQVEYNSEKGTVTIAQDILFESSKPFLNNEGKEFIQLFTKILNNNILNNDSYKDLIKYVHIEGNASSDGTLEHNFKLSFERAKNVWSYMTNTELESNNNQIQNNEFNIISKKLNIVSRGEIDANQIEIDDKDRKVIFRFEFYDTYNELFKGLSK